VVEAAYAHVIATDLFAEVMAGQADPEAQLLAVCKAMVAGFLQEASHSWQWRVISREAMAPRPELAQMREALLVPKILLFRDLVSALVDLPDDHPAVVQGCLAVMAPIVLMQVGDWTAIGRAFAGFRITQANADDVARSFYAFTLGGLRAVAAGYRNGATQGQPLA
jgi:TetR/AcrR family transcriptional regulator, regulator of cefoperazone and chloramphenicol sensitivity